MRELMLGLLRDDSAISAVEYSAMLAFICVALVGAALAFGDAVLADYTEAAGQIAAP